jgi:probable phosphoglycerate mutase
MVSGKREIFLVRHGETDFNRKGIVQGSGVDSSLNDRGRAQALLLYERLCNIKFDFIVHSELKRTRETLDPFLLNKETPAIQRSEINEINWGVYEGQLPSPEARAAFRSLIRDWDSGKLDARLEEGESAAELEARTRQFTEWLSKEPFERVLICSHGRTIRALHCTLCGLRMEDMSLLHHNNTGLFQYQKEEKEKFWTPLLINDIRHLDQDTGNHSR